MNRRLSRKRGVRPPGPSGWIPTSQLAAAALSGALAVGCSVALLGAGAYLVSRAALQPPILALTGIIIAVRLLAIGRAVFGYLGRRSSRSAALSSLAQSRGAVIARLEPVAQPGHWLWRGGDQLRRFVDDVDSVVDLRVRAVLPMMTTAIVGTSAVLVAVLLLPIAGVLLLVALLVGGIAVPFLTTATLARAQRRAMEADATLASVIRTGIESAPELVVLQAQDAFRQQLAAADARSRQLADRASWAVGLASGLEALTKGLAVVGSLITGAAAARSWDLPGVELAVVVLLPLAAYESVSDLPEAVLTYQRARASKARVAQVLDQVPPRPEPCTPRTLPDHSRSVRAVGLTVHRPSGPSAAIADLSLDLSPGRRVAIVGPTGSGTSSLALALLGALPYSGSLTLDGVPYRDLPGADIRRAVGLLAGREYLFSTSVEHNLRVARPDASGQQLAKALAAAGLTTWVRGLPDGLATTTGRPDMGISTGHKQRLALARIVLGGHRIVILDEPTEALDPVEGPRVLADMFTALADRGVLLITHEIEFASACDQVIVLVGHGTTERGAPAVRSRAGGSSLSQSGAPG